MHFSIGFINKTGNFFLVLYNYGFWSVNYVVNLKLLQDTIDYIELQHICLFALFGPSSLSCAFHGALSALFLILPALSIPPLKRILTISSFHSCGLQLTSLSAVARQ